jgi:hypothetical protein
VFVGVAAARRLVEAVAEEEELVRLDEDDGGVVGVIAAHVAHLRPNAAQIDVETGRKHDLGGRDPDFARRRQLRLDVGGMLWRDGGRRDAMVERFVAPIGCRQLLEIGCCELVGDYMCSELIRTEDVVPVGVRQDDVTGSGDAVAVEEPHELACVCRRGSGVQPDRAAPACDGAQGGTVGESRREPVDVLADARSLGHGEIVRARAAVSRTRRATGPGSPQ